MSLPSNFLTATETIAQVAAGRLSVSQLARDHIARFDERDSAVRAWAYFNRDKILRDAEALDAIPRDKRGPLFGATIGVKDIINTFDMPTQHGSKAYTNHRPGGDASLVHILRQAGALLIGKTITTEFASTFDNVPTRNPYDSTRTPGGSSSGSGAAVRDYQCQISLGTQTVGSVIRPASYNGVFGMKPTWNSVPKDGIKMSSVLLDTPGFFARSLTDIQLLLRVLNVRDDVPPPSSPKPLSQCRFAYCKTAVWTEASSPDLERVWKSSRQLLERSGAIIEDLDLGTEFEAATSVLPTDLRVFDHGLNFRNEYLDPEHRQHLEPMLVEHVENKSGLTKKQVLHAMDSLAALRPKFDALAERYDAVITPSIPGEAPQGTKTGDPKFNAMWTALHVPCVHVPGFAGENGMPIGLTLVGPRYYDEKLLSVSKSVAEGWMNAEQSRIRTIDTPQGTGNLQV